MTERSSTFHPTSVKKSANGSVRERKSCEGESQINRNGVKVLFPTYIESQGWSLSCEQKKPHDKKRPNEKSPTEFHEDSHVSNADIMQELFRIRRLIVGPEC